METGPTQGLTKPQPKGTTNKDRIAADFFQTFGTDQGRAVIAHLRTQLSRPPEVTNVNPNEYAWHYIGERRLMHLIEDLIVKGEKIVKREATTA